jgi:hypothetical protein
MAQEPSEEDEQQAIAEIEAIKELRLVQRTRNSYDSKNKGFASYLLSSYPHMLLDGKINLDALTLEAFQAFIVKKQSVDKLSFSACSVHTS